MFKLFPLVFAMMREYFLSTITVCLARVAFLPRMSNALVNTSFVILTPTSCLLLGFYTAALN